MRNFSHVFQQTNTFMVNFSSSDDISDLSFSATVDALFAAFGNSPGVQVYLTSSEQEVIDSFCSWFGDMRLAGVKISASYPRSSTSNDVPKNTSFAYVNCNTGLGVVITGFFDDGYGEFTFCGEKL